MAIVFSLLLLFGVVFIFLWDSENNPIVEEKEVETIHPFIVSETHTVVGKFINLKGICSTRVSDNLNVKNKK